MRKCLIQSITVGIILFWGHILSLSGHEFVPEGSLSLSSSYPFDEMIDIGVYTNNFTYSAIIDNLEATHTFRITRPMLIEVNQSCDANDWFAAAMLYNATTEEEITTGSNNWGEPIHIILEPGSYALLSYSVWGNIITTTIRGTIINNEEIFPSPTNLTGPEVKKDPQRITKNEPNNKHKIQFTYNKIGNRVERIINMTQFKALSQPEIIQEEMKKYNIKIYPNPTRGQLKIELSHIDPDSTEEFKGAASIYNQQGLFIKKVNFSSNIFDIDISSSQMGLYHLYIDINGEMSSWKILKQ